MATRMVRGRNGVLAASVLAAAVLTGGSASAAATGAADTVPGDPITVEVLSVNGSGCPAGSADVKPLADNTGFTVAYRNYVATAGPGAEPTDFRKNCQLGLLVHVPQGFTYAVARAEYNGLARLSTGASGLERANYYFQGSEDNTYSDHEFDGPLTKRWSVSDTAAGAALVYAPCGTSRVLNVNTELRVYEGASTSPSAMAMTSSSGGVNTIYRFSWKAC
jgi:hypothetical protein